MYPGEGGRERVCVREKESESVCVCVRKRKRGLPSVSSSAPMSVARMRRCPPLGRSMVFTVTFFLAFFLALALLILNVKLYR